jgi:hypothetical protein
MDKVIEIQKVEDALGVLVTHNEGEGRLVVYVEDLAKALDAMKVLAHEVKIEE